MPHRNLGIIRPPTNFTIDRILSKNDQRSQNQSPPLHSPAIIHHHYPMNKVLESNPWIPKFSPLVLPFNPSFSRKLHFTSISSPNYLNDFHSNIPINYANSSPSQQHCLASTFNYLLLSPSKAAITSTATASIETKTQSASAIMKIGKFNENVHNHSKYSVYEDSQCDNLNQFNNSLSLNLSVVNSNKNNEEKANRRMNIVNPIIKSSSTFASTDNFNGGFRCAICLQTFDSCELLKVSFCVFVKFLNFW